MLNLRTPSPTFATTPAVSCTKIRGAECEPVAIFLRSVPQIPQGWTRTRISPGPTSGTGTSSKRTSFTPRYTAALIVEGISRLSFSTVNIDVRAFAMANFIVSPTVSPQLEYETEYQYYYVPSQPPPELFF